ncbi:MAG: four helix bundle protein [Planctomycetota bacterium]
MDPNELEDRLIDFAVRVIRLSDALPNSAVGKHIARQLLRSGTSPAPNYAEARGAESSADFIHKLKIALKELNETSVWLRMIKRAELIPDNRLEGIIDENIQLCRILNATVRTKKRNQKSKQLPNDK